MKPFDLQKAIDGHPLCTRDGRDVTEFYYFKSSTQSRKCVAVVGGLLQEHFESGMVFDNSRGACDLFLKSEKKKLWIQIRKEPGLEGVHDTSQAYDKHWIPDNSHLYEVVQVEIDV